MPHVPPNPTPIYRIMHAANLSQLVQAGRLVCENLRAGHNGLWRSIAHENIQHRRRVTTVPCGPGGVVNDYVPWYFGPKSPMLYAHFKGNVPGNPDGQQAIIYLRSTVQAVIQAGLPFVFTDGHSIMFNSNFHADPARLDQVDWPLMRAKYWHAIDGDPDRPRRRQAEFLVHQTFPWGLVQEVVVFDAARHALARTCLQAAAHQPTLRIDPTWYY